MRKNLFTTDPADAGNGKAAPRAMLKFFTILMPVLCAIVFNACVKSPVTDVFKEGEGPQKQAGTVSSDCTSGCWIGTVNQSTGSKKVELYSYYAADWNVGSALTWSWKPTAGVGGYTTTHTNAWGTPNDFKIRDVPAWGGEHIAAIGNGGLITIATYPGGTRKWSVNVGGSTVDNIHSVELLSNGNCAVAAPVSGWVRLYKSSVSGSTSYLQYNVPDAHSVHWDPSRSILWALGRKKLVALVVGGSAASPSFTDTITYTNNADDWGHSIGAYYGDVNKLYVTSSYHVWVFDKNTHVFTLAPGLLANRNAVKAISNQPDGTVVLTRPDDVKSPVPSDPAPYHPEWATSYVDYYTASGTYISSGHRVGASYYKGFVFNSLYEIPGQTLANGKYKITSRLSGKALAVAGASTANSAKVIQYGYTPTNPNDEWNVTRIGSTGYYRITNVNSSLDMAVQGAVYTSSADIIQYGYTNDAVRNDEWYIVDIGGGYYSIVNRRSDMALNVEGASMADSAQIIQYPYSNVPQNQWVFTIVP